MLLGSMESTQGGTTIYWGPPKSNMSLMRYLLATDNLVTLC